MENNVRLIGRLGKDPEEKETKYGNVYNLSVATWRTLRKDDGTFETLTEWHRVVTWQKHFPDIKTGDMVVVNGMLKTRNYEDADGKTRYITEVTGVVRAIPKPKADTAINTEAEKHKGEVPTAAASYERGHPEVQDDDDLPF